MFMKTKLKTLTENKEKSEIEKLLKNKNLRNNQNYVISKKLWYSIVRKFDFWILKVIFVWILTFFSWNIVFTVSVIIITIFWILLNSIFAFSMQLLFVNPIIFIFLYFFSIFITIYKINKIWEKRFFVLKININKAKSYDIRKKNYKNLSDIWCLLIRNS